MKKQTNIKPVTGIGIKGYQVTFSILDLYKMRQLAFELYQLDQVVFESKGDAKGNHSLNMAFELLNNLFEKTIGETDGNWDCFTEEEGL